MPLPLFPASRRQANKWAGGTHPTGMYLYRPHSVVSEGYVFTGVCHSFCSTLGGGGGQHQRTRSQHPPPEHGHGTWSQHPPPEHGHGTWSQHPPPSPPEHGHGTWSQHPPPPTWTWDLVTTPAPLAPPRNMDMGPGHNTHPLPPPPEHGHGTWSQHPPPLPPGTMRRGRYASYWNAFLLLLLSLSPE